MVSVTFPAWVVLLAAHVICGAAAAHGYVRDWREYRRARVRYVVGVMNRTIDREDYWMKPKKPRAWAILLLPPVVLDLMLLWGWIEGALRHG